MPFESVSPVATCTSKGKTPQISLSVIEDRYNVVRAHMIVNAAARAMFFPSAERGSGFDIQFGTDADSGKFIIRRHPDGMIIAGQRGPAQAALTLICKPWDAIALRRHRAIPCKILGSTPDGVLLEAPRVVTLG